MKRTLLSIVILFSICSNVTAQFEPAPYSSGAGMNSVTIYEASTPEKTMLTLLGKAPAQTKQTTQYFDGNSRLIQTVTKQGSPTGKDLVSQVYYDELGRTSYSFLPFVSTQTPGGSEVTTDGLFKLNPYQQQKAFFGALLAGQGETYYYSKIDFDNSPLNRVVKTYLPGNSWVGANKFHSAVYDFNNANENVHIWTLASNTSIPSTSPSQVYPTGKLSKLKSIDENGNQVITYTDMLGNLILKKVREKDGVDLTIEHAGWACTYYVYDDFNQLRYVVTPKAVGYLDTHSWTLTNDIVNDLCFSNEYDERARIIVKKQPGVGPVNMVYDKKDRLVFMQDANLNKFINTSLSSGKWIFNVYDIYDRAIATGLVDNNLDRQTLQDRVDNNLTITDIVTISAFVGNGTNQLLSVNCPVAGYAANDATLSNSNVVYNVISHYDNYIYDGVKTFNSSYTLAYTPPSQNTEVIQTTTRVDGFMTGEKVRVIDNDNNNANDKFLFSSVYYDDKGRLVQTLTSNIKNGTDYETNQYDFAGKIISSFTSHNDGTDTYTITTKEEFDKDGRLTAVHKNFNNSFYRQIAQYLYDELGRIKQKRLAPGYTATGKNEIETQDFTYNIHSRATGINKDFALSTTNAAQWDRYFGFFLGYDNKDGLFTQAQYDGSITGSIWKSQGDNSMRKFNYTYDFLGRFKTALFMQKKRPSDSWANTDMDFSTYTDYEDQNGNLKSLKHMGVVPGSSGIKVMDDLRYYYKNAGSMVNLTGNKLLKVDDNLNGLSANNGILGDFKDHNNTAGTDDYDYDFNGNLVKDDNKNIAANGIVYNYLGKPSQITIQNKSVVEYIYDATGQKLTKKVTNTATGGILYTHYMGEFVYEEASSLTLQYILHEEGRLKVITPLNIVNLNNSVVVNAGTSGVTLPGGKQGVFEYFVKDHLGSTRVVLTEEVQKETYRAYMETANAGFEEQVFGKVILNPNNTITIPTDNELKRARTSNANVTVPWTNNNTEFVSLSAASGKVMGPNALLKVMAGDIITTKANYFYFNNNSASGTATPVSNAVTSLVAALTGSNTTGIGKVLYNDIDLNLNTGGGDFSNYITSTQPGTGPSTAPKAYLNIVFLDEQFKFIPGEGITGVGSKPQRVSIANTAGTSFDLMAQKAPKNGWVYVYLSNESTEPVYFDDFWVDVDHARISEENHYYPHGLKIAGISSRAFNKLGNKFGFQGSFSEEEEESGYDEFELRLYDPQIGRWAGVDPYDEYASPYVGMGNNPISGMDADGGGILADLFQGSLGSRTFQGALLGGLIGAAVGILTKDEDKILRYMAWGALIGGGLTYILSSPSFINVQWVPNGDQIRKDIQEHGKKWYKSPYLAGKIRAILNEIVSLGKIVTITGDSFVKGEEYEDSYKVEHKSLGTLTSNLVKYFKNHPNAVGVKNALTEFHSGYMGYCSNLGPSQFSGISPYFDANSTFIYGNCFQASAVEETSTALNGATVIGSYTQQLDLPFVLRGRFSGNPELVNQTTDAVAKNKPLETNFLRHRVAQDGKLLYDGRAMTNVRFSGRITFRKVSETLARKMNDIYFRLKGNVFKNIVSLLTRGY